MKEYILKCLRQIEEENDVQILLAVESGSRAWGFASKDSDWDVRYVYMHRPEWYFHIEEQKDVIEDMFDNDVDAVGWDLKKTLFQLKKSNPALLEWMKSPIVYRRDDYFVTALESIIPQCYNPIKAMYHYHRIYVKQDERYLQKQGYPMKRFLYYLRGILACQWIERYKTIPPVRFQELYEEMVTDPEIKQEIDTLIEYKTTSKEMDMSEVPSNLVDYAKNLADYYVKVVDKFRPTFDNKGVNRDLNRLFYEIVESSIFAENCIIRE